MSTFKNPFKNRLHFFNLFFFFFFPLTAAAFKCKITEKGWEKRIKVRRKQGSIKKVVKTILGVWLRKGFQFWGVFQVVLAVSFQGEPPSLTQDNTTRRTFSSVFWPWGRELNSEGCCHLDFSAVKAWFPWVCWGGFSFLACLFQCSRCPWKPARTAAGHLQGTGRSPPGQVVQRSPQFCSPNFSLPR